ncbi:MAG: porin [Gammaproteobacteria bacterium]|nr:porin [Gammaproteobacteria bacterium]
MRKIIIPSGLFAFGLLAHPAQAAIDVYGQIHLSAEYIDLERYQGDSAGYADTTLSSNATTLGLKGEHELNYGFKAMWVLESNVDIAGERDWLVARNRYVGLEHAYGTLIAGYHDTPVKQLGERIDFWPETIGDRRNILGYGMGLESDVRARNCAMFVFPTVYNTTISFMGSVGNDDDPTSDSQYLVSSSLLYQHEFFFFGMGAERQMRTDIRHDSARFIGGITAGGFKLNGLIDYMKSPVHDAFDRRSIGGGASYTILDTSFRLQGYYASDYQNSDITDAVSISAGISQSFSKSLQMYLIYATTINGANAQYGLGAGEHGDHYSPDEPGINMYGVSAGINYRFE